LDAQGTINVKYKKTCIILIITLVLIGAFLSLPYFLGRETEKALKYGIGQIPTEPGISISVKSYHRGWLQSDAVIQVAFDTTGASQQAIWKYQLNNQGKTPPKLYLNIHEKILHGPFMVIKDKSGKTQFLLGRSYARGKMDIPESERQMLTGVKINKFDNANTVFINLSGLAKITTTLPLLSISSQNDQNKLIIKNFTVNYSIDSDLKSQKGDITLGRLVFTNKNTIFTLSDLAHQFKLERKLTHLWTGNSEMKIGEIDIHHQSEALFNQKTLKLQTSADVKNKLLDLTIKLDAGKAMYDNFTYGPIAFRLQALNIGAKALNNMRILDEKLQSGQLNHQQYFHAVSDLLPNLLGHGAQVHLSPFNIGTPYGDVKLNANITFPNTYKDQIKDLKVLFKNTESLNQLTVPKKLTEDLLNRYFTDKYSYINQFVTDSDRQVLSDEQINQLVHNKVKMTLKLWQDKKYLNESDDNYVMNLGYKDSVLTINGNEIK